MPSITVVQHSPPEEPGTKLDSSPATLQVMAPLEVVAGRFEVRAVAGSGGNGVVYRALDRQTRAEVALKVLRRCEREDRARFVREAAALSTLAHPHVVRYVAHGVTADGTPYLAMEWLEGESLWDRLGRGALHIDEAVRLARRLAEALGSAHAQGVVHRDIKPSNIFLVGGSVDDVRLIDFGLVRPESAERELTQTGAVVGTPGYMAPEQARGTREVDPRADVFALGCVLFECVAGRPAFEGSTMVEVLANVLLEPVPALRSLRPDVPEALSQLVARMLAKPAEERPLDGLAVALPLRALEGADTVRADERVFIVEHRAEFRAPGALVWALFADTNRWNRLVGSPRTDYSYDPAPGGGERTVRTGRAELLGVASEWTEEGEAIEGRFLVAERVFRAGIFQRNGYRFSVEPTAQGCAVNLAIHAVGDSRVPEGAGELLCAHLEQRLHLFVAAVEKLLASAPARWLAYSPREPAVQQARRLVLAAPAERVLSGRATRGNGGDFALRAARFREAPVSEEVRERLLDFVQNAPDDHLRHIRPYELAHVWDADRRELLRGFLHASRAGLLELRWQLHCPTCRVAAAESASLEALAGTAYCAECQAEFAVDLACNVEVAFHVSRALREVDSRVYCAGSPAFRPHLFASLRVGPRQRRTVSAALPAGGLLVRALPSHQTARLLTGPLSPRAYTVRLCAEGTAIEPGDGVQGSAEETELSLVNETDATVVVQLERPATSAADMLSGAAILAHPEFAELFPGESPTPGVDLTVSALAVLWTELDDIGTLCDRLGDGRAYALAREFAERVAGVVARRDGAVVRAHGETVMACFASPAAAIAAGEAVLLEAEALGRLRGAPELAARAGVHDGTCLLVRTSGRADFFGRTVRTAARLMALAPRARLALHAALAAHPEAAQRDPARLSVQSEAPTASGAGSPLWVIPGEGRATATSDERPTGVVRARGR